MALQLHRLRLEPPSTSAAMINLADKIRCWSLQRGLIARSPSDTQWILENDSFFSKCVAYFMHTRGLHLSDPTGCALYHAERRWKKLKFVPKDLWSQRFHIGKAKNRVGSTKSDPISSSNPVPQTSNEKTFLSAPKTLFLYVFSQGQSVCKYWLFLSSCPLEPD